MGAVPKGAAVKATNVAVDANLWRTAPPVAVLACVVERTIGAARASGQSIKTATVVAVSTFEPAFCGF